MSAKEQNPMKLEEGNLMCPRCRGVGRVWIKKKYAHGKIRTFCPKCKGTGKLDWVEMAMGKK